MAYNFRGQFLAKMDDKSRLAIPAGLRTFLSEGEELVVTNFIYQQQSCLDVYSKSAWQNLENRIHQLPSLNADVQAFQRFYLSAGQAVGLDKQNRILIPKALKDYANLGAEVCLVGMGEKFEIWDASKWQKLNQSLAKSFESIMAGVAALEGEE